MEFNVKLFEDCCCKYEVCQRLYHLIPHIESTYKAIGAFSAFNLSSAPPARPLLH